MGGSTPDQAGEEISDDWYPDHEPRNYIQDHTGLQQKVASGGVAFWLWTSWRMTFRFVLGHYSFDVEGCVPVAASAVFSVCPGARPCRWDASQATTSEISSGVIGFPGT